MEQLLSYIMESITCSLLSQIVWSTTQHKEHGEKIEEEGERLPRTLHMSLVFSRQSTIYGIFLRGFSPPCSSVMVNQRVTWLLKHVVANLQLYFVDIIIWAFYMVSIKCFHYSINWFAPSLILNKYRKKPATLFKKV